MGSSPAPVKMLGFHNIFFFFNLLIYDPFRLLGPNLVSDEINLISVVSI